MACLLFLEPPKFVQTPQNRHFNPVVINIGDGNPTCEICVNCTVTGDPPPSVTWEYQHDNMPEYSPIITNQTNASSPYYEQENGQVRILTVDASTVIHFTEIMFQ